MLDGVQSGQDAALAGGEIGQGGLDEGAFVVAEGGVAAVRHGIMLRPARGANNSGGRGLGRSVPAQEGVDEDLGVEGGEVFGLLARADEAHGHVQLSGDGEDDAALAGAVELGQADGR